MYIQYILYMSVFLLSKDKQLKTNINPFTKYLNVKLLAINLELMAILTALSTSPNDWT